MTTPTVASPPPALVVEVSILLPSADFATDLHRVKAAIDNAGDALSDQVSGAVMQIHGVRWSTPAEARA